MESRAKVFGHPAHQMLIVFPVGLLVTAVIFDVIYYATSNGRWADISFWMIASGLIGGVVAAIPGLIDWSAIPSGTRAKAVGTWHAIGNVVMLGLYGVSLYLRVDHPTAPPLLALLLSAAGMLLGGVTAWLGGELVDRLGVGVDPGAHLNAPNSLTHPAPGHPSASTAASPIR